MYVVVSTNDTDKSREDDCKWGEYARELNGGDLDNGEKVKFWGESL